MLPSDEHFSRTLVLVTLPRVTRHRASVDASGPDAS